MVSFEKCKVVFIGRVFCAACIVHERFSHIFFSVSSVFVLSSPLLPNRTDGCTTADPNWGTNEPNNGNQVDNSTETVAAILFLDVTIGTMTSYDAGTLYDDKKSNLHPAIYECCESSLSGGCPSEAPSMMPSAGGGGLM